MESIKKLALILALSFFSFSVIAQNDQLDKAINHAEEASKASDSKGIAAHAEKAQPFALAAKKEMHLSDERRNHLEAGIISLGHAVEKGNLDATDSARHAAEEAVRHFKEVKESN